MVYPLLTAGSVPSNWSTKSAAVEDGVVAGPREARFGGSVLYVVEYATMVVFNVRSEATADASLAAIFERSKFGIAIAAIIKIIATTINNSISEKPFCLLRMHGAPFRLNSGVPVGAAKRHMEPARRQSI